MERTMELTADGSATLFVPALNEHYHSIKGALTESQHVFIDTGMKQHPAPSLHILEIGFGTGLNAWLTLREAIRTQRAVLYQALEYFPLSVEETENLPYGSEDSAFDRLHRVAWDEWVVLHPLFHLCKRKIDFTEINLPLDEWDTIDVIYFDAFAPEKQPAMWTEDRFAYLYRMLRSRGILTTYCAKGEVRRTLQRIGFDVRRMPGPPQGKREILQAFKA
jgi:tRNA U34 5-methylaminomethyl-2-thiouridine-forming methyltransferase MnmC